jgi:poly(A) polymerase Pap1
LKINPHVQELFPIDGALVPLIRLKYYDISFDILFAKIDMTFLGSKIDICDDKYL